MTADAAGPFRATLQHDPADRGAMAGLAQALAADGRYGEALGWIERAIGEGPAPAEWDGRRGSLLLRLGRVVEAVAALRRALARLPDHADLRWDLGRALERLGRADEAIAEFRRAVRRAPGHAGALASLGGALWQRREGEAAIDALTRAVAARPDWTEVRDSLGNCLHAVGHWAAAERVFEETLRMRPGHLPSRLNACVARLRMVYADDGERVRSRAAYGRDLRIIEGMPLPASAEGRTSLLGARKPFLLAYQGEVDRDLQAIYGGLVCRTMALSHPDLAAPPPAPGLAPAERIRVGILSGFFRHHSNWKMRLRAWLEDIDRDRFQLHAYYTGGGEDAETARARALADRFVTDGGSVEGWARRIRADRLHVLLIPEIGMDPQVLQLAALRLAPVQATSWGHPQTSGMPTIDDFLSSALMEPPDGDTHYTERLVRLPGLSCRPVPVAVAPAAIARAEIGVEADDTLFWCCQSLYKYLPAHDDVFPRIAQGLPSARFLFLGYAHGDRVDQAFRARIGAGFAAYGLDAGRHCRFLGTQPADRFAGLTRLADIFLDSIGWSGCNSTIEALGFDLPVVTWPGVTMRARHSAAILRLIGVEETVAGSKDEYVDLAVRLGGDGQLRARLRDRIAGCKAALFEDRSYLAGLEAYLAAAAERPR